MNSEIFFPIIATIISAFLALIIQLTAIRLKKFQKQKASNNINEILTKNFDKEISKIYTDKTDPGDIIFYNYILSTYKNTLANSFSNLTVKEFKK